MRTTPPERSPGSEVRILPVEFKASDAMGWVVVGKRWFDPSGQTRGKNEIEGVKVSVGERGMGHDDSGIIPSRERKS